MFQYYKATDIFISEQAFQNRENLIWPVWYSKGDGWIIIFELVDNEDEQVRIGYPFHDGDVPPSLMTSTRLIGRTKYPTYYGWTSEKEKKNGFNNLVHPDAYVCTAACMKEKKGKWKMLRIHKRV